MAKPKLGLLPHLAYLRFRYCRQWMGTARCTMRCGHGGASMWQVRNLTIDPLVLEALLPVTNEEANRAETANQLAHRVPFR